MSKSRLELKVGIFVLFCLIVLAVLMLQFSKGTTFFRPTYSLILKASNVGGLKVRASVLMSGVQVGTVSQAVLSPEGTNVTITLTIYKPLVVHKSARFVIETSGFLGDQFVAIYPDGNVGPILQPGDEAIVQEPFNFQEVARNAAGFIKRIDETAKNLNDAINEVRRLVLNEETLTNLSSTIGNFQKVSDDAHTTVQNLNGLVISNQVPITSAISNLEVFTRQLNGVAVSAQEILNTNSPQLAMAISNVQTSTIMLTNMLADVQAGHGPVGALLRDQQLTANFSIISSNLAVTSSNLNHQGLWRVVWGPKQSREKSAATQAPISGRDPFK